MDPDRFEAGGTDAERDPHTDNLATDGGTATAPSTDDATSVQDVLDELHHDDAAARVTDYLATGDAEIDARDFERTLALAQPELCLRIKHDAATEYVWLNDEWSGFVAAAIRPNGDLWTTCALSRDDLANRISTGIDLVLSREVPIDKPSVSTEADQ